VKERAPTGRWMSGYALHPEAFADVDDIWEYLAEDNIEAADRLVDDIFGAPSVHA